MPRTFRVEREVADVSVSCNPFDAPKRSMSREQMTNQELVQSNQKLQNRVQKLTMAFQAVEQQNVMLKDRCLRLQNRVDELKTHLSAIKNDVGQRVAPLRIIAGHLFEFSAFLESLDNSIETGLPSNMIGNVNSGSCSWSISSERACESKRTGLEAISEVAEVPETEGLLSPNKT